MLSGGVVFPIMLAQLFGKIGFRSTLRWVALMIGVMLIIANVLITPALPPKGLAGRRSLISLSTFKKPTYLLYASGSFFFFWGLFGPFDYLPTFAMADASTSSIALYTVAIVKYVSLVPQYIRQLLTTSVLHRSPAVSCPTCTRTGLAVSGP